MAATAEAIEIGATAETVDKGETEGTITTKEPKESTSLRIRGSLEMAARASTIRKKSTTSSLPILEQHPLVELESLPSLQL